MEGAIVRAGATCIVTAGDDFVFCRREGDTCAGAEAKVVDLSFSPHDEGDSAGPHSREAAVFVYYETRLSVPTFIPPQPCPRCRAVVADNTLPQTARATSISSVAPSRFDSKARVATRLSTSELSSPCRHRLRKGIQGASR